MLRFPIVITSESQLLTLVSALTQFSLESEYSELSSNDLLRHAPSDTRDGLQPGHVSHVSSERCRLP